VGVVGLRDLMNFWEMSDNISKMVQDKGIDKMKDK